jgi:hypothetical protein
VCVTSPLEKNREKRLESPGLGLHLWNLSVILKKLAHSNCGVWIADYGIENLEKEISSLNKNSVVQGQRELPDDRSTKYISQSVVVTSD